MVLGLVVAQPVDAALEADEARAVGVGGEHRRLVAAVAEPLGHGDRRRGHRRRVDAAAQAAEHAVLERGHERHRRRLRPGRVRVGMLEDDTLARQLLQERRRRALVAVEAHQVGAAAVDDVEDDVGRHLRAVGGAIGGGAHVGARFRARRRRGDHRSAPECHGARLRAARLEDETRVGAGERRQIDRVLAPARGVGDGLGEERLALAVDLGGDAIGDGLARVHPEREVEASRPDEPQREVERRRRVGVERVPRGAGAHDRARTGGVVEAGAARHQRDRLQLEARLARRGDEQRQAAQLLAGVAFVAVERDDVGLRRAVVEHRRRVAAGGEEDHEVGHRLLVVDVVGDGDAGEAVVAAGAHLYRVPVGEAEAFERGDEAADDHRELLRGRGAQLQARRVAQLRELDAAEVGALRQRERAPLRARLVEAPLPRLARRRLGALHGRLRQRVGEVVDVAFARRRRRRAPAGGDLAEEDEQQRDGRDPRRRAAWDPLRREAPTSGAARRERSEPMG